MKITPAPRRLLVTATVALMISATVVAESPTDASIAAMAPQASVPAGGAFPENTLAGIYELALQEDLSLERARAELRVGQEARKLALSGLLPQVRAGLSRADSETDSKGQFAAGTVVFPRYQNTTNSDTDRWDVSLRQPVFNMPAWFRMQRGGQLTQQAEATFSVAQQALLVRTVAAYTAVLRASANLRASRSQEQAFTAQLDQVQQRFDVGMVAITDVHEAKAAYDLAVAQRISDEGRLGTRLEQLSLLTGRQHGDLWELGDEFPVLNPDPASGEEWVTHALANNLDIRVASFARDAASSNSKAASSERLPTVDLSLSYTDTSSDFNQKDRINGGSVDYPSDQETGLVALSLNVPLYTGGYISSNRRQALAQLDATRAGYDNTVRTVTQETRALHIQVVADVATNHARAQAVTSTRSALDAAEVGYEVGTRNVVDVLSAQREYYSSVRDYENSIFDYVQDMFLLKRLAGILSPSDIYDLNRWLEPPKPAAAVIEPRRVVSDLALDDLPAEDFLGDTTYPELDLGQDVIAAATRPQDEQARVVSSTGVKAVDLNAAAPVPDSQPLPVEQATEPVVPMESAVAEQLPQSSGDDPVSWLLRQPAEHYTLQLVVVSARENAERFVREHGDSQGFVVYAMDLNGQTRYAVVYGAYSTRSEAAAAAARLPEVRGAGKPWVRRLAEVQPLAMAGMRS